MRSITKSHLILELILLVCLFSCQNQPNKEIKSTEAAEEENKQPKVVIGFGSLLENMRDISHLPKMLEAKTAMSSTWDTTGGNEDGTDFKKIEGRRNVLLDIDGPGVIHRIFTGRLSWPNNENIDLGQTQLQIFIDNQSKPVIDIPMTDFFSNNPFTSYPFVFDKNNSTYPGFLLPIPFKEHIKVQLWSQNKTPVIENWGNFWQLTYTTYAPTVTVESFDLPLSAEEKEQMKKTGSTWINAENQGPGKPENWEETVTFDLTDKEKDEFLLEGSRVIDALRVEVTPNTPEALKDIRFRIYWDGMSYPSVDVPLGYFFGNADYASKHQYNSLFMGIDSTGAYSRFPMPFSESARIEFSIPDNSTVERIELKLNYNENKMNEDYGYFHATWTEQWATALGKHEGALPGEFNVPGMPKYGEHNVPVHIAMDRKGIKGKYVGMLLHVAWPSKRWWGEGDVLIWTDESGWPPSYHGTGTEEYFNAGWGDFDRKAVSGHIKMRPGNVLIYSFHINDAFNFNKRFKIGLERWNWKPIDNQLRCAWGSTAFWYAKFPLPAESKQQLLTPRLNLNESLEANWN